MEIKFTGENNTIVGPYYMIIGGTMVVFESLLLGEHLVTQGPTALDTPHQVLFGPAVNTGSDPVSLAADGTITFNEGGSYFVRFDMTYGRSGSAGISEMFIRFLAYGVQAGASQHIQLTDSDVLAPYSIEFSFDAPAGFVFTSEIIRESSGNNSGELVADLPSPGGWNDPVSARVDVGRWVIPT